MIVKSAIKQQYRRNYFELKSTHTVLIKYETSKRHKQTHIRSAHWPTHDFDFIAKPICGWIFFYDGLDRNV